MNREAEHVDRRVQQRRVDPVPQQGRRRVGLDQVPEPVHDQRRIRLVGVEQPPQRLAQRLHHLPVVRLLQVGRREAARQQQPIALGHRQVEALCEVDEELAAGARAAGLDEAEMLGREIRVQRQLELAQPARVRQKRISSPTVRGSCSVATLTRATVAGNRSLSISSWVKATPPYMRGNRHGAAPGPP
jgi:hypothetical protein